MICKLSLSDTDCPGGRCIVVASPYGMAEVCVDETEFECLKHLGVLTEEDSADYHQVSLILDILRQCPAK